MYRILVGNEHDKLEISVYLIRKVQKKGELLFS